MKHFLKKHGEPADWMGWSLDLFAKEGVLGEGEVITVAGKANWRDVSDFRLKIPVNRVLFIQPLNEHGVYLSDDPYI